MATKKKQTPSASMPPDLFDKLISPTTRAKFSDGLRNAARAHAPEVSKLARQIKAQRSAAQVRVLKEAHLLSYGPLMELKKEAERPTTIAEEMITRGHL